MSQTFTDEQIKEQMKFWEGTLADAKEMSGIKPVAKDIKLKIYKIDVYNKTKDGSDKQWKQIKVRFQIVDGIDVGGVNKYKNTYVEDTYVYYASPDKYDLSKQFYKSGAFLVPIKQLVMATDSVAPPLVLGGISDGNITELVSLLEGATVLGSILQVQDTAKNAETGEYEKTGEMKNVIKNFKKLPDTSLV